MLLEWCQILQIKYGAFVSWFSTVYKTERCCAYLLSSLDYEVMYGKQKTKSLSEPFHKRNDEVKKRKKLCSKRVSVARWWSS